MGDIVIVDTSVLLNVLDVPAFNQDRAAVFAQFRELLDSGASFLLPMAAIFETGDHIADLRDGRLRRRHAEVFRDRIREALKGDAPWVPIRFPDEAQLAEWLETFPDSAMAGLGMSDFSIVKAWEVECARHPTGVPPELISINEGMSVEGVRHCQDKPRRLDTFPRAQAMHGRIVGSARASAG